VIVHEATQAATYTINADFSAGYRLTILMNTTRKLTFATANGVGIINGSTWSPTGTGITGVGIRIEIVRIAASTYFMSFSYA
jgi:hypothetical protein